MGILSGLGAGLNAAAQGAIGNQQGQIQGSALMRAIQMQQYQIAKEQADTEKSRAETAFTQHRNLAPVLGESSYAPAQAAVKGAETAAETPGLVDRQKQLLPLNVQQHYLEAVTTLPLEIQKLVKAGQISLANGITLATQRQGFEHAERLGKQDYETGAAATAHQNAKELQASGQAGNYANAIGEKQYGEQGSIVAPIMRKLTGHPAQPVTPSQAPSMQQTPAPTTPQQLWDAAVQLHGRDKVLAEYGPRPE